jgi:predicted O-methyltransferase YrrM
MTALGWPMGFFTQYPLARQVASVEEPYPEIEALCAASPFREFLRHIQGLRREFAAFGGAPTDPELDRGMFPALDGLAAYAAVRRYVPTRVMEIGSGDSTYFLAKGVKENGRGTVTCIDPKPRRQIADLDVRLEARMLESSDARMASELGAGDILFIDSSHILLPGMDVDIQLNRMFPRLKPGVIVHLHDIFLPDDYPASWRKRNYSEQNALAGWLLGGAFKVIWPANYIYTRYRVLVERAVGDICDIRRGGGSLWLRKT